MHKSTIRLETEAATRMTQCETVHDDDELEPLPVLPPPLPMT